MNIAGRFLLFAFQLFIRDPTQTNLRVLGEFFTFVRQRRTGGEQCKTQCSKPDAGRSCSCISWICSCIPPVLNPVPMLLTWPGCGKERTHEFAEPPRAQAWRLETLAASYFSHSSGACTGSAWAPRERHCPWEPSPSGGVRSRLHWVALSKRGAALSQESLDNSQQHARDADVLDCVAIGTGEEFQCQLASQVPSFKILPKDRRSGGEEGGQALRQRVDLAELSWTSSRNGNAIFLKSIRRSIMTIILWENLGRLQFARLKCSAKVT
jgi:hypothetical protein